MPTIGGRLRWAREWRVWTQQDLAGRAGVRVVTISRIENDRYAERPRSSTIQKLARALEVEPAWLLFGEKQAEGQGGAQLGPRRRRIP